MFDTSYRERRDQLETYFDRTAAEAWARLTADAPVSRIRETVRAGRDTMRQTLLDWLPGDLTDRRVLDAGCGTGAFAVEAARRGAEVVAIDVAGSLVEIARERTPEELRANISYLVGDMLSDDLGGFDHVVAMDSLIHYAPEQMVAVLARLAADTSGSIVFTFAPATTALRAMHVVGRAFPRSDRAPAIVPVAPADLRRRLGRAAGLSQWRADRDARVKAGFYISHALELRRQ
jgi:magnesium-protoporphyrin O-methyltransferase